MNDRPTAKELIDAARLYLEKELLPALTDARQRFQTLVAANVLSIAARDLESEERMLSEEHVLLGGGELAGGLEASRQRVRELNEAWCLRIRQGEYDDPIRWREEAAKARHLVVRKLEVANPRYLQSLSRKV